MLSATITPLLRNNWGNDSLFLSPSMTWDAHIFSINNYTPTGSRIVVRVLVAPCFPYQDPAQYPLQAIASQASMTPQASSK